MLNGLSEGARAREIGVSWGERIPILKETEAILSNMEPHSWLGDARLTPGGKHAQFPNGSR